MSYTVHELATLAGVSARTLHYYDEIGLLNPTGTKRNGYRFYEEAELLKLQQILFFKELDFPLADIQGMLSNPRFSMERALRDQKKMLELKKDRLDTLVKTINKTIKKINKEKNMKDDELYDGLDTKQMEAYAKEAKERWGKTDAWKQSQERTKNWTKADYQKIKEEGDKWMERFLLVVPNGIKSPEVQALIAEHYNGLRKFYEPNLEMYRGLGSMYVDDSRFTAYYDKHQPGLAVFMKEAMHYFCDNQ
jgi:DNA-binding transcriptional MerR regulator